MTFLISSVSFPLEAEVKIRYKGGVTDAVVEENNFQAPTWLISKRFLNLLIYILIFHFAF